MTQQLTRSGPIGTVACLAGTHRRPLGLALVLTVQLMLVLDATVINVALPQVQSDLGFSPAGLSWVLNAYTLAFGGLLLLGGRLGDVFGRRHTFTTGLTIFTLASLLGGLAQSPGWLVTSRTLQGVGAAIAARNRALALFSAVSSAGASLGLILGGLLTGYASWRWSLFINVPLGAAVLALVPRFVDETPRRPGRFDVVGALTATLGSTLLVYGFISAPGRGWTDPVTVGSFAVAAALIATFVRTGQRIRQPLLDLVLLRNRRRVGGIITMALMVGSQFAFFFFTVQFMQHVLGYGALRCGLAYLPLSLLIFVVSRFAANLTARFGIRRRARARRHRVRCRADVATGRRVGRAGGARDRLRVALRARPGRDGNVVELPGGVGDADDGARIGRRADPVAHHRPVIARPVGVPGSTARSR